jgi:hypothetical protein
MFKASGKTGEVGNVVQTLAEVSEVLLIGTTGARTLLCIRDGV